MNVYREESISGRGTLYKKYMNWKGRRYTLLKQTKKVWSSGRIKSKWESVFNNRNIIQAVEGCWFGLGCIIKAMRRPLSVLNMRLDIKSYL